jgi:hypothetical protein
MRKLVALGEIRPESLSTKGRLRFAQAIECRPGGGIIDGKNPSVTVVYWKRLYH